MPTDIEFPDGEARPVATEQELLDFINRFREASGQELIDKFFPSVRGSAESCLIALGVNSDCRVDSTDMDGVEYDEAWGVSQFGDSAADALRVARQLGLRFQTWDCAWVPLSPEDVLADRWEILLPEHIGNAAYAFDEGVAFQNYAL